MVQIKLENMPLMKIDNKLQTISAKPTAVKRSMVVYMCKQCNIYFPIRRMLELHDKSVHPKAHPKPLVLKDKVFEGYYKDSNGRYHCQHCSFSSIACTSMTTHMQRKHAALISNKVKQEVFVTDAGENNEDDENSWEVETLDENLPILAKAKHKEKDPTKLPGLRKCPFCPFSCDNSSTYYSHVKRKHQERWLKLTGKEKSKLQEQDTHQIKLEAPSQDIDNYDEILANDVFSSEKVGVKRRQCPHCSFETPTKSTLYSHIHRTHRGKRSHNPLTKHRDQELQELSGRRQFNAFAYTGYACSYCTFAAATVSSLKYHTAREHGDHKQPIIEFPVYEFDCDQCDYKTKSRKDMQQHLKTMHLLEANEQGMFACHICSYDTLSKMGVQRHISIKHDKPRREAKANMEMKPFMCELCQYETYNAKILEWHKKQHSEDTKDEDDGHSYFCNDCDFVTWTKGQLFTHIKRNHKREESTQDNKSTEADAAAQSTANRFSCDQCDYTSKNKHVMKVHVIRKHTDGFNHECELCGKKYKVKADLTNHMRFQHREQPIICDVCGKTCRNSNLLYLHQKFAHYKPEFECHICHRRMVSQANLDDHILKQHEQRQDVVCEECGKTFTRATRLKLHMRTHLGLRPYSCKICGKAFARRNGLRQHLLIHTGKRPYVCDICGKDFTQKTGLISHRKSHPGSHPPLPRVTIEHVLSDLMNEDEK